MTVSGIAVFGGRPDSAPQGGPSPSVQGVAQDVTQDTQGEAPAASRVEGFPADYVALDLETTGFYPNSCAITEIGAVRVRDRRVVDRFQRLVNPLRPIPPAVVKLTGITDDMVAGLDPIDQVLPEFVSWLAQGADATGAGTDDCTGDGAADAAREGAAVVEPLIGHNIRFDLDFLDWNTRKVLDGPFSCVDFDTMQISRTLFSHERRHRLLDLIQRFGIADNEEHRALSDAIQTQQCFEWMHKYVDRHAGRGDFGSIGWRTVPMKRNDAVLNRQIVLL